MPKRLRHGVGGHSSSHTRSKLRVALAATNDPDRRLAIVNSLLSTLEDTSGTVIKPASQLLSVRPPVRPGLAGFEDVRPATPLSEAALLTNSHDDPRLGSELRAELDSCDEVDLICALDVIEHVVDPHAFIDSLKPHLRKGGVVLLLTGDADAYPARIAGPQWSYLRWCGHISVFSRAGLRRLLESHGFEVLTAKRCEHPSSPGAFAWWRVHLLEPVRRILGRDKSWYPFWRDHQTVIARLKG